MGSWASWATTLAHAASRAKVHAENPGWFLTGLLHCQRRRLMLHLALPLGYCCAPHPIQDDVACVEHPEHDGDHRGYNTFGTEFRWGNRPDRLRDMVEEALANAVDNGYGEQMATCTPEEVAADLARYDADLEEWDPDDLLRYVRAWQLAQLANAGPPLAP
jgi:hypothetical protein